MKKSERTLQISCRALQSLQEFFGISSQFVFIPLATPRQIRSFVSKNVSTKKIKNLCTMKSIPTQYHFEPRSRMSAIWRGTSLQGMLFNRLGIRWYLNEVVKTSHRIMRPSQRYAERTRVLSGQAFEAALKISRPWRRRPCKHSWIAHLRVRRSLVKPADLIGHPIATTSLIHC